MSRSSASLALLACLLLPDAARAQSPADPHAAQPERPTVATHAWTVAPRYAELETGIEWDRNLDASFGFSTPTVLKIGLGRRAQLGAFGGMTAGSGVSLGAGDAGFVLKVRLADDLPLLGAFAVQPGFKFPVTDQLATGRCAGMSFATCEAPGRLVRLSPCPFPGRPFR